MNYGYSAPIEKSYSSLLPYHLSLLVVTEKPSLILSLWAWSVQDSLVPVASNNRNRHWQVAVWGYWTICATGGNSHSIIVILKPDRWRGGGELDSLIQIFIESVTSVPINVNPHGLRWEIYGGQHPLGMGNGYLKWGWMGRLDGD